MKPFSDAYASTCISTCAHVHLLPAATASTPAAWAARNLEPGLLLSVGASPNFCFALCQVALLPCPAWRPKTCGAWQGRNKPKACKTLPAGRPSLPAVQLLFVFMKQHGGSISAGASLPGLCAASSVIPYAFLGFPHGAAQKQRHNFLTDVLKYGRSCTGPFCSLEVPARCL